MSVLRQLELLAATVAQETPEVRVAGDSRSRSLSRLHPLPLAEHLDDAGESEADLTISFLGGFALLLGGTELRLPLRLQEILLLITIAPGITSEKLAAELYEDGCLRSVKVSVSKLRKHLPISTRVYEVTAVMRSDMHELRRALSVGDIRTAVALYRGPLLPNSNAPGVVRERHVLEETVKRVALASGDLELILALTGTHEDDLEIWEAALAAVAAGDPRLPIIEAQVQRIKREWNLAA
jgi:hypothetical protein